MINTLIIDDEARARSLLKDLINTHFPKLTIVGEADDVAPGVAAVRQYQPELLFLDIHLSSGTGFDLLAQVSAHNMEVIFVTAHDQYAIRAFQFSAIGYLLKPVRLSELKQVIERVQAYRHQRQGTHNRFRVLIENYEEDSVKKLVVQHMHGFRVLHLKEILYLEGEINYTRFVLHSGEKILVSKTLKEYEKLLCDFGFHRVHQSYLINLRYVRQYLKGEGGQIIMENGAELAVSRRKKAGFLKKFLA